MKVPGILKNKYVFYALAALAVLNVVGYVSVQAWECLALFVLTACCANTYCKDRSCAILAALFVANFVFGCGRVKEGFEDAIATPAQHLNNAAHEAEKGKKKALAEGFREGAVAACSDVEATAKGAAKQCGDVVDASGNKICKWEKGNDADGTVDRCSDLQ